MPVALYYHPVTRAGGKVSAGRYFERPNRGVSSGRDRMEILQLVQQITPSAMIERRRTVAGSVKHCRVVDDRGGRCSLVIKGLDL